MFTDLKEIWRRKSSVGSFHYVTGVSPLLAAELIE